MEHWALETLETSDEGEIRDREIRDERRREGTRETGRKKRGGQNQETKTKTNEGQEGKKRRDEAIHHTTEKI